MSKKLFFIQLELLLMDLPDQEREAALADYNKCLEEAGPEQEAAVLASWESPEHIASKILAERKGEPVVTEQSEEQPEEKPEKLLEEKPEEKLPKVEQTPEEKVEEKQAEPEEPVVRKKKRPAIATFFMMFGSIILIIILTVLFLAFGVGAAVCIAGGILILVFHILGGFTMGITVLGIGLVLLAIFILLLAGEIGFCRNAIPAILYRKKRG